jgi:predicted nucleotidyltransferase component of viral defense system
LHSIFHSKLKNSVIFKGGTALSKCYGMIDRFSEDIDLVLLRDGSERMLKIDWEIMPINSNL